MRGARVTPQPGRSDEATGDPMEQLETIRDGERVYAQVIRAGMRVTKTTFYSDAESSFQFGLLAHESGFTEAPHYHRTIPRSVSDLQQMFVMQRGVVAVDLFRDDGTLLEEVRLLAGDAIVLVHGAHSLRVIEDFQAISVKQGPFLGSEYDKVLVDVRRP